MYFIKKFIEFFFPKIDENIQIEGLSFLSTKEKEYFLFFFLELIQKWEIIIYY